MPNNYYIDLPIALIIILAFIHGYRKGILSFVIPFVAIAATILLFPLANAILVDFVAIYNANVFFRILLFILIYVLLRVILEKFREFIEKILNVIFLQWINKIVGGVFVAFVALAIVWAVYVLLAFVIPNNPLELNSMILNAITNTVFTRFNVYEMI